MNEDTKALLKAAFGNAVSFAGYVSTASTFLPVMVFLHPYLRTFGVFLIIVGIFWGARSVISKKSEQLAAAESSLDTELRGRRRFTCLCSNSFPQRRVLRRLANPAATLDLTRQLHPKSVRFLARPFEQERYARWRPISFSTVLQQACRYEHEGYSWARNVCLTAE